MMSFQMVAIGYISTWHSYVVGAIAFLLNCLLLFVICFRSIKVIGAYKYMMMVTTVLDILFSAVYIVASPVCASG